ncbi:hypothetical protein CGH99_21795 [Vibrio parahaemolyticus]|nr:hypothetical protein CGH99_21795 [Vibrio parahaemolyticus]TOL45225.1 hypothetical protein CGH96_23305 [Vibrio parahaemolyticus]TOL65732.1 hypothetical protein CGH92_23890 [Vibrio parahaemolyticus]TON24755.1 hypothetical protein CGH62_22230 [Vibrio parahaemolyticus]TOO63666.1 hypothetical protein CGH32_23680 [Vibrio parahaemolyticus]
MFTAQWFRLGGGVVHPLMRRYATEKNFSISSNSSSLAIRFLASANQHFRLRFFEHSTAFRLQGSS